MKFPSLKLQKNTIDNLIENISGKQLNQRLQPFLKGSKARSKNPSTLNIGPLPKEEKKVVPPPPDSFEDLKIDTTMQPSMTLNRRMKSTNLSRVDN